MRVLKLGLAFAFLAAAGGAGALYFHLNSLVEKGIETFGPLVTRTSVRLKSASLSPFTGRGTLKGLVIGNADGFEADTSFGLRKVQVFVELSSLADPKIVVHEIIVDAPIIIHEAGPKGVNLEHIRRSIETFLPPGDLDLRFEVGLFLMKNATVRATLKQADGKEGFVTLPVPAVVLTDIGKGEGATPKEAAAAMLGAVVDAAQKAVAQAQSAKDPAGQAAATAASKPKDRGGLVRGLVESGLNFVAPWLPLAKRIKGVIDAARR